MSDSAEDEAGRLKSIHNERTKLSATYMDGVAIAAIAIGGLAPIAQNHFETLNGSGDRGILRAADSLPRRQLRPRSRGKRLAPENPMPLLQLAAVAAFPVGALIVGFGAFWFASRAV